MSSGFDNPLLVGVIALAAVAAIVGAVWFYSSGSLPARAVVYATPTIQQSAPQFI